MPKILMWIAAASLVAGLLLVFVWDGDAGWFVDAPESDSAGLALVGGRFITDEEVWGWILIAASAVIFSGVAGYNFGSRQHIE